MRLALAAKPFDGAHSADESLLDDVVDVRMFGSDLDSDKSVHRVQVSFQQRVERAAVARLCT